MCPPTPSSAFVLAGLLAAGVLCPMLAEAQGQAAAPEPNTSQKIDKAQVHPADSEQGILELRDRVDRSKTTDPSERTEESRPEESHPGKAEDSLAQESRESLPESSGDDLSANSGDALSENSSTPPTEGAGDDPPEGPGESSSENSSEDPASNSAEFDAEFDAEFELPSLSSTVRASRALADGGSSTRVGSESFRGQWRHGGDLVGSSPGATVLDFGGLLATTTVSIRGASADQVLVTFDGVPLNPSAGGGMDLSLIPAALLDEAEIRRGAEGASQGAGAMGGSVLLSPAQKDRVLITGGTLGSMGLSGAKGWQWGANQGLWSLLVAADFRRSAGDFVYHRDPTPEIPDNDPLERLRRQNNDAMLGSGLLRVEHRGPKRLVSAFLLAGGGDRGLAGPIYSPTPKTRQRQLDSVAGIRLEQSFSALKNGFAPIKLSLPLSLRGGMLSTLHSGLGESDGQQLAGDFALSPELELPLGDGGRGSWSLFVRAKGGLELFEGEEHGSRQRLHGGLGLEAARKLGRWTASASGRAEQWGDTGALLGRVGGSVRPWRWLLLFGNVGNGFRPPSFGELYFAAGPMIGNPDLLPERSSSADLGTRLEWGPFQSTLSLFGGLYQDTIIYELFPGFRAKPFNVGKARVYGAELEAALKFESGPVRGLDLRLAYTELRPENRVPGHNTLGNDLPYRPRRRLMASGEYQHSRFRSQVELQAVGSAYANRANTREVDPYLDLRAGAGLRLWRDFWLAAEVRNALNVQDRMSIDGYPLPGILFLGHLSWEPGAKERT